MISTSFKILSGGLLISALVFSTLKNEVVKVSKLNVKKSNSLVGNLPQTTQLKKDINENVSHDKQIKQKKN
jgi:hypothetical protein